MVRHLEKHWVMSTGKPWAHKKARHLEKHDWADDDGDALVGPDKGDALRNVCGDAVGLDEGDALGNVLGDVAVTITGQSVVHTRVSTTRRRASW